MKSILTICTLFIMLTGCGKKGDDFDASGSFEADEVIVAAQQNGQIRSLNIREGMQLLADATVGQIDITNLELQKQQAEARVQSLSEKLNTAAPQTAVIQRQIEVLRSQISYLQHERQRTENLVNADAATRKQLDDITAKLDEARRQLAVYQQQITQSRENVSTQNRSVLSEKEPLEVSVAQIQDQINKGTIVNPAKGLVLSQYAFAGEMTAIGKPLYKIANTDTITLRAYITGDQLPVIRPGQTVHVRTDNGKGGYRVYSGKIYWIASKAEFTPKTIQTKEERQNQVYAVKISVPNDGYLKIGMYGELKLNNK